MLNQKMLLKNTKINKEKICVYLFLGVNFLILLGIVILAEIFIVENFNVFEDNKSKMISLYLLQQLYYLLIPLRITIVSLYLINCYFLESNKNKKLIQKLISIFNNKVVYIFIGLEIIVYILYRLVSPVDISNYFICYFNIFLIFYTIIITSFFFIKFYLIVTRSNKKTVKNLLIYFSLSFFMLIFFAIRTVHEQFEYSHLNTIVLIASNIVLYFLAEYSQKRKDEEEKKINIKNVILDIRELPEQYKVTIGLDALFEILGESYYVKNVSLIAALNIDIRDYLKKENLSRDNVEMIIEKKNLYFLKLNSCYEKSISKSDKIKLLISKDNQLINEYLHNKKFLRKKCNDRQMLILILDYSYDKNFDIVKDKVLLLDFKNSNNNKHYYEVSHV